MHTVVAILITACVSVEATAEIKRIVFIKADGLSFDVVDRLVHKQDPYTGKSVLPWIDYVFYRNGTRLSNFHSRGLSVSVPSWAMLDTGQQSIIKGNLEFDRFTLEPYDYLNTFSFLLKDATGKATGTAASHVLDEFGVPVVSDAYLPSERFVSVQVTARELQSISPLRILKGIVSLQNPRKWFDEWTLGLEGMDLLFDVFERDLIEQLGNPKIRYLDFLSPFFDHVAHISREPEAQQQAVQKIDGVIKRIWTAIQESPLSNETALVLVSDHGMNSDETLYSQGFNLIEFFGGAGGGGHHILTNRPPQSEFSFKALSPTVPLVVTSSPHSYYLKGKSSDYPTLALDADGNERASIYLRQSDLNVLHILFQQLLRKDLARELRPAIVQGFFATIERNRTEWMKLLSDVDEEISAIRRSANMTDKLRADEVRYREYLLALHNLLTLPTDKFDPSRYKIEQLIPTRALGQGNSVHDLQNYVVGLADNGIALHKDGTLDFEKSFARVNYFSLLRAVRTRNNVQPALSPSPVDFIAVDVEPERLTGALPGDVSGLLTAVWLFQDNENQAVIVGRRRSDDQFESRYIPVRELTQDRNGDIHFKALEWSSELPLNIWEDLKLPAERKSAWLDAWHSDGEWFEAFHTGKYTNAVVNLQELFRPVTLGRFSPESGLNPDAQLIQRFRNRKRKLTAADFVIFANDHWNFNFRGFNPGGNHGGFFRASTHSTLMIAGGNETGIPRGLRIDHPYDSLSLAPTVLRLVGKADEAAVARGPVIRELLPETGSAEKVE